MEKGDALSGTGFGIGIYSDGTDLEQIRSAYRRGIVEGITTNPTLMAKGRVRDYRSFAREVLAAVPDLPVSFQVLADDLDGMAEEARQIAGWGEHVFVKIPITTPEGESTVGLMRALSAEGVRVNATAVLTLEQVASVADAVAEGTPAVVSVFAGRIADTGRDPCPIMREAVALCGSKPRLKVLWASPREVLNVYQAAACGCHVISLTPDLLAKLELRGKDLEVFSLETVRMFHDDGKRAGYTL